MAEVNSEIIKFTRRRQESYDSATKNITNKTSNKKINFFHGNDEMSELSQEVLINSHESQLSPFGRFSSIRQELVEWMSMISSKLKLNSVTIFKAFQIFDLSTESYKYALGVNDFHLIAGTSMFIAMKLQEVENYKAEFIRKKVFHSKFEKSDILGTEGLILKKLKFKIPREYFVNFLTLFLNFLFKNISPIFSDTIYENYKMACSNFSLLIYKLIFQEHRLAYWPNRLELFIAVILFSLKELDSKKIISYELIGMNFFQLLQ